MNSFERRNRIVDMVNTRGSILVLDLSNLFDISEVTTCTNLRLPEEEGLLTRFHGDVTRAGSDLTDAENQEAVLEDRCQLAGDPKKRIVQAAVAMIREGMTAILDSGGTILLIAEALVRMTNIIIIISSLPATFTLAENKDIVLVICGGTMRHKTHSMHGAIAECSLQGTCADLMLISTDGIDATNGIVTSNEGYSINSVMTAAAHQAIAVPDASKFNHRGFNQVLPMEKMDCVTTGDGISENDHVALSSKKMELKIA